MENEMDFLSTLYMNCCTEISTTNSRFHRKHNLLIGEILLSRNC